MNGKRKAFASGFVVAFLLCGVFGGLVVEQSLAYVAGFEGVGGTHNEGNSAVFNSVTFLVPDDYLVHVTEIHAYLQNYSGSVNAQLGVYNQYDSLVANGSVFVPTGEGWYNSTLTNCYLTNGTAWLAVSCSGNGVYRHMDSVAGVDGDFMAGALPLPQGITRSTWGTYRLSLFVDYEYVPLSEGSEGVVDASVWLDVGVSLFLVGLSILLALKGRSWAVCFLFGLSLVGFW